MSLKNDRYTYRVTWSEDDSEYVGLCAEFPSLSWLSKTPEAALKGIRKVVAEVVEDMRRELYLKVVFKGKGGVSTGRLLAAVNRPH